jgi:hypothetical protein
MRSVCLEVTAEGDLELGYQDVGPRGHVIGLFEAIGTSVVEEGCDATLTIDLRARLVGADYGPTCYEGRDTEATAQLTASGLPPLDAAYMIIREPPDRIAETACTRDPQVPVEMWQGMLESDSTDDPGVLTQLLGDRLLLARELLVFSHEFGVSGFSHDAVGDPLAPWVIDTLAGALYQDDRLLRSSAALIVHGLADDLWERSDELFPLVPYLIRALAAEDAAEIETRGEMDDGKGDIPAIRYQFGRALEEITNEEMDYRADLWWDWWQDR